MYVAMLIFCLKINKLSAGVFCALCDRRGESPPARSMVRFQIKP